MRYHSALQHNIKWQIKYNKQNTIYNKLEWNLREYKCVFNFFLNSLSEVAWRILWGRLSQSVGAAA